MKTRKKLFCSLFTWIFKHLTRITLFNDASVVHKDHMIGNVACKCHLMGYNDHRRILVLYDSSSDEKTERIEKLP